MQVMIKMRLMAIFLMGFQLLHSQSFTISGFVEDKETGERLIGVYVIDAVSKKSTQTNNFGFFNLKAPSGSKVAIQATYIGMKSKEVSFIIHKDTTLNIVLNPVLELNEVVISSSRYGHNVDNQLGFVIIPVKQLTITPALGESDLLKAIQIQPGIKGGVEGSAGIYVRGGSAGENLFMLNDVPIYNVSHLYGFFSAFNSSAIKDIKLIKGCFPAKYGGRVSSVIDVRSRDGNNKSINGEISIGVISSKFNLEGPIINDKTTFNISARRSYFDLYSGALKNLNLMNQDFPGYYFYDLNASLTHKFSQKDKILLSLYKGKDKIVSKIDNTLSGTESEELKDYTNETSGWGNLITSLRWNHTFNNNLFVNSTIAYSRYNYFTSKKSGSTYKDTIQNETILKNYSADYNSDIYDIIIKSDFEYSLSNSHKILFGAGNTIHTINPGKNDYSMIDQDLNIKTDTSFSNKTLHVNEAFVYLEDEINTIPKLLLTSGLRISGFISENSMNLNVEPRVSANYEITPHFVIKTGYSRMVQYIHLLTSSGLSMPTDIWIPSLEGLKPLKSDQINFGLSFNWAEKALVSIEVYQKWLYNTTDYRNGASLFLDLSPWYQKTTQGKGNAKGIEVSVEKQIGKITGSINYTLSTASRQYDALNNGHPFPFDYDRLHDFNISINYKISEKWDFSALWIFGTGYPATVQVEKYSPALSVYTVIEHPFIIYYYPSLNNLRLPPYHRLDVGIHHKKQGKLGEHSISFDIFNAYNRKNPINMYYWLNYSFKYNYLLPIIPSLTYTLRFK